MGAFPGSVSAAPEEQPDPFLEAGQPFYTTHFAAQDYGRHPQNWSITQDDRGIIYVANKDGVLEFDGTSWRRISSLINTSVLSVSAASDGRVFVGSNGDFGYLRPDSTDRLEYVSLIDHVPEAHRNFEEVWKTHTTSHGVYFQARKKLFRWNGSSLDIFTADENIFHTSFQIGDRVFVNESSVGLQEVKGDVLSLLPHGEYFATTGIHMLDQYGSNDSELMVATRQGLFVHTEDELKELTNDVSEFFAENNLYHGTRLSGGFYAMATLGGGVKIINGQGETQWHLTEDNGLPDNWVNYVFEDKQGGIWLALNNRGITRLDFPGPLTRFDYDSGLRGTVNHIERHQENLFISTSAGLFVLVPRASSMGSSRIRRIDSIPRSTVWSTKSVGDDVLVATDAGLYSLSVSGSEWDTIRLMGGNVYSILTSERFSDFTMVGHRNGLALVRAGNSSWVINEEWLPTDFAIWSLRKNSQGEVWAKGQRDDVLRFDIAEYSLDETPVSKPSRKSSQQGVPAGDGTVRTFHNDLLVSSISEGIYRFDRETETFQFAEDLMGTSKAERDSLLSFHESPTGEGWLVFGDGRIEIVSRSEGGELVRSAPRVLHFEKKSPVNLLVEENGVAWIGSGDELLRYDPAIEKNYDVSFTALIREVTSADQQHTWYGGAGLAADEPIEIDHTAEGLRFAVGAPSFNDPAATVFQYRLEGKDEEWTDWTSSTVRYVSDLSQGEYTLSVRARNAQGIVSEASAFSFVMLPPWYRTWWAYMLYLGGFGLVGLIIWNYRRAIKERRRAQKQAQELARERVVNERLQQANRRLQQANYGLQQANQLKDEFLANTSHELRTPLTAILGFTSVLQEEVDPSHQEFLELIEMNGERLLTTVNSLLDLAKLRAGMMDIDREVVNTQDLSERIARMLKPLADEKNLRLEVLPADGAPALAMADRRYLEQILFNLIGNAIKFTEEGSVEIGIRSESDTVQLWVTDTGIGIGQEFLPHLFEEFKQESSGLSRSHEGSGLGLSITARLVEMMEGEIEVESEKGTGTTFTVHLPRAEAPDERDESQVSASVSSSPTS